MRVAVFGGTGFVGKYLVRALLESGYEVSLLVRAGSEHKLDQADRCRLVAGDIASPPAVAATLRDCDALIYNIGILRELPGQGVTFESLHFEGARAVIEAAPGYGVGRALMMSANGVRHSGTPYQETKFRADELLINSSLQWTVFRPSVIFGDSGGAQEISWQLYRDLVRPPLPAPEFHTGLKLRGNEVMMSPVAVEDVAAAFLAALANPDTIGKIYQLGGPEALSWGEMVRRVALAAGKNKVLLPMPIALMKFGAALFGWMPFFPVTRDQLSMLAEGNTADPAALRALIGREPREFAVANLGYLQKPGKKLT